MNCGKSSENALYHVSASGGSVVGKVDFMKDSKLTIKSIQKQLKAGKSPVVSVKDKRFSEVAEFSDNQQFSIIGLDFDDHFEGEGDMYKVKLMSPVTGAIYEQYVMEDGIDGSLESNLKFVDENSPFNAFKLSPPKEIVNFCRNHGLSLSDFDFAYADTLERMVTGAMIMNNPDMVYPIKTYSFISDGTYVGNKTIEKTNDGYSVKLNDFSQYRSGQTMNIQASFDKNGNIIRVEKNIKDLDTGASIVDERLNKEELVNLASLQSIVKFLAVNPTYRVQKNQSN